MPLGDQFSAQDGNVFFNDTLVEVACGGGAATDVMIPTEAIEIASDTDCK